jgi:hypothetical protein
MKGFDRERRVVPPALPKKPLQASAAKGLKYKMGRRNDLLMYRRALK